MKNFIKKYTSSQQGFRWANLLLIFSVSILLSSCISRIEKRGYMFDMSDYNLVKEGVTSKERVIKLMGLPTFVSNFDEEAWIYYSEDVRHLLFFEPKIVERKVLSLHFDQNNIVKDMQIVDLEDDNSKLKFAQNSTPVDDHENGWFKSFVGGIGQIRPIQ